MALCPFFPNFTIDTGVINTALCPFSLTSLLILALSIWLFVHFSLISLLIPALSIRLFVHSPWLHYWYRRYQYGSLSIFPNFTIDTGVINMALCPFSPNFTIDTVVINTAVCLFFPNFTIDTSVIGTALCSSFPWLYCWHQRYQYDSLYIFSLLHCPYLCLW